MNRLMTNLLYLFTRKMLILRPPFDTLWSDKNPFVEADQISKEGPAVRAVKTRQTRQFNIAGRSFYIKFHQGSDIGDILNDLIRLRLPVLGASREWRAVEKLRQAGVGVMKAVAFGEQGSNPLARVSFIITEDLAPCQPLSNVCLNWKITPPSRSFRTRLMLALATTVRGMHDCGINHRDCYLGHFMLAAGDHEDESVPLRIAMIDLHRAQIRNNVPRRWRDKDLTELYSSALQCGLTQSDCWRFLKAYFGLSVREIARRERWLLWRAPVKARHILERTARRQAATQSFC